MRGLLVIVTAAALLQTQTPVVAADPVQALPSPVTGNQVPNILVILADDLGYSDPGCYGGEIQTPNLDRLAADGLRFTQFYNTARCWPSRAALMTGYYAQQVHRDGLPDLPKGLAMGGRGVRPEWAPLLPALLKSAGYRSYHSGKWHIDGPRLAAGFDKSLSVEDHNRFFFPQNLLLDDKPLPPVAKDSGYYLTTGIAEHAIQCLQAHARAHGDQPFLSFVAFTSPHFPLQALPEDIAKYRELYRAGWNEIRQARYQRQLKMGLITAELSPAETEIGPPYDFPKDLEKLGAGEINRPLPWQELTPEQQEFQAAKMAVHAAMVDRMDQEIGRILAQLDAMHARENTLICFLSDNGASAEIMVRGDGHDPAAAPGSAGSYLCLGPGWSTAANTPFRRHKTWVHEGGISTPLVVSWPAGIPALGELRHTPGHIIDLLPTVLEVARTSAPEPKSAPPRPGLSLVPLFKADTPRPDRKLWWLHEGNRAFRHGDWKIVAAGQQAPWELYNLGTDRTELHNLAQQHPDKLQALADEWKAVTNDIRLQVLGDIKVKK